MALRYKEIKALILDMIVHMDAHTRIPSRTTLCEKFLVTRTTVDRAISELIGEGQLYSVDGSGTYVSDLAAGGAPVRRDVMNIGVLLPNIMHDTYPGFLRGIEDIAEAQGINVVICNTDNNAQKQMSYLRRLFNSKVSGIAIIPAVNHEQDHEMHKLLLQAERPFVLCNRSILSMRLPLICSNDYYGGYIATRHLLSMGYERIAYISTIRYKVSVDRYYGYLAALWEYQIQEDDELVCIMEGTADVAAAVHEMTSRLLERDKGVDGIFCFNDQTAHAACNAIAGHGLRVSDDIGIIGYDDTASCEMMQPRLSSVSYRNYEIGSCAAKTILHMIDHPDEPARLMTIFQPRLMIRDSCLGKRP